MKSLLEELYTPNECKIIQDFFTKEETLKQTIVNAVGTKLILEKDKILISNPLDILYVICLHAEFATSEDECLRVAPTIYQHFGKTQKPLPMLTEDFGLAFANKTLIALSFFANALEHRWKYHAAPMPSFYRKISKNIFDINGQPDIASHHEQWEGFLGEMFV